MRNRFCRFELRTTDVGAAREFYVRVFGPSFWGDGLEAVPLPAQAAARGAPPHWLGLLGVEDVEETVRRFIGAGAVQIGPATRDADRNAPALLRDPYGAVLGITTPRDAAVDRVASHVLNAEDEAHAFATYSGLFGWRAAEALDLGESGGRHQPFAWDESGRAAGSMTNLARLPHVHPQWLFFFRTDAFDDAVSRVRARGGTSLTALQTPEGDSIAACEDPQGAAFGLFQRSRRRRAPRSQSADNDGVPEGDARSG